MGGTTPYPYEGLITRRKNNIDNKNHENIEYQLENNWHRLKKQKGVQVQNSLELSQILPGRYLDFMVAASWYIDVV